MNSKFFENLKTKTILILGFGKEGIDSYKFLRKLFPEKVFGIGDKQEFSIFNFQFSNIKKDKNIRWHLGENYLKVLKNYDVIIKSPGIPPKIFASQKLRGASPRITSQTEIFFDNCPGKIVGITGTKGKSTTASLVHKILKEGGIRSHLVGNIGKPVLSLLFNARQDDVYVYELSSHQLCNLKKSPHIAVLLNIYPEHLDYYRNFKEYVKAKANIVKEQGEKDFFVYNLEDGLVREIAAQSKAKKIPVKGRYYSLDKAAATAVGKLFKIPAKIILKAIKEFKFLPHRLELVGTFKRITFYNDSLSTIPETAIAALDSLGGKDVQTLLLGGFDRGLDFKDLAKRVIKSRLKNLILFPTSGQRIWQEILCLAPESLKLRHFWTNNMREAVRLAYKYTEKGKICLLSCASPSFGIFKDYKERGNLFKKFVRRYGKN